LLSEYFGLLPTHHHLRHLLCDQLSQVVEVETEGSDIPDVRMYRDSQYLLHMVADSAQEMPWNQTVIVGKEA